MGDISGVLQSSEIIAALIGVAGVIIGVLLDRLLITPYLNRRSGRNIVTATRISQSPQIRISERAEQSLQITYKGIHVDRLVLNVVKIRNDGYHLLNDVAFKIAASSVERDPDPLMGTFLEVEHHDPDDISTVNYYPVQQTIEPAEEWEIHFQRPHFNPARFYKDEEVELAIFANRELDFSVEGGGPGWRSEFREARKPGTWLPDIVVYLVILLILLLVVPLDDIERANVNLIFILVGFAMGLVSNIVKSLLQRKAAG